MQVYRGALTETETSTEDKVSDAKGSMSYQRAAMTVSATTHSSG